MRRIPRRRSDPFPLPSSDGRRGPVNAAPSRLGRAQKPDRGRSPPFARSTSCRGQRPWFGREVSSKCACDIASYFYNTPADHPGAAARPPADGSKCNPPHPRRHCCLQVTSRVGAWPPPLRTRARPLRGDSSCCQVRTDRGAAAPPCGARRNKTARLHSSAAAEFVCKRERRREGRRRSCARRRPSHSFIHSFLAFFPSHSFIPSFLRAAFHSSFRSFKSRTVHSRIWALRRQNAAASSLARQKPKPTGRGGYTRVSSVTLPT